MRTYIVVRHSRNPFVIRSLLRIIRRQRITNKQNGRNPFVIRSLLRMIAEEVIDDGRSKNVAIPSLSGHSFGYVTNRSSMSFAKSRNPFVIRSLLRITERHSARV